MIRAIVFDFDGVLVNSEPLHLRAYQEVLAARGILLTRQEYYSTLLGFDDEGVFRAVADQQGWTLDREQMDALIDEKSRTFERMIADGDVLYPGARECVATLAQEFPLGIASGALAHEIRTFLASARLDSHFRFIVGSGDTPRSKPAPDPYRRAAELHRLAPGTCLAIEDSRWGIESAKGAGLLCIGITHTYRREELASADVVIDSLAEFTPALIRSLG